MRSRPAAQPFTPVGSSSPPRLRPDVRLWCIAIAILVLLFLSFRAFVLREVAWAYPANYDQTKYLGISYSAFEVLLQDGFSSAVATILRGSSENGLAIHLQALALFLFFGASRLTALSVNFLHLAVYALIFAGVVKHTTGNNRIALLALGLAFGSGPFWFGNLVDYRLDFSAACVFGMFVSAVVASGVFRAPTASLVAGVIAGILILTRFITAVYVAGIFAVLVAYFAARSLRSGGTLLDRVRLRHSVIAAAAAGAVGFPALWVNRLAIYNYYVVLAGSEREIRAIEFPAGSLLEAFLYYPRSLILGHVGIPLAITALSVLAIAAATAVAAPSRQRDVPRPASALFSPLETAMFLVMSALVVLAGLNTSPLRSPVVIGILLPVFSWFVLVLFYSLVRPALNAGNRLAHHACAAAAIVSVASGVGMQVSHFSRHMAFSYQRSDVEEISALYDAMGKISERAGWRAPLLVSDSARDYLTGGAPTVSYYERRGALIRFAGALGSSGGVHAGARDSLIYQIKQAQFLVLTHRRDPVEPPYPLVEALEALRPQMEAFARDHLVHVDTFKIFGRQVDLYCQPGGKQAP